MKSVKWQDCAYEDMAIGNYLGKMPNPDDPVTPGMQVCARYKDLDVHLRITSQIQDQEGFFAATVLYFEPVGAPTPDDVKTDDEVRIDRQHICGLYEK